MTDAFDLESIIREQEALLLRPDVRADPVRIAALLTDDFIEIGSSGRVYQRADILLALPQGSPRRITMADFQMQQLAPTVVRVSYCTISEEADATRRALRSSIWVLRDGRWQMCFHQGTPLRG